MLAVLGECQSHYLGRKPKHLGIHQQYGTKGWAAERMPEASTHTGERLKTRLNRWNALEKQDPPCDR